jgi:xanthosine utilization system XapX-like protein
MIIALLALIAVGVVFIALQTRKEGTPVIAQAFSWHLLWW